VLAAGTDQRHAVFGALDYATGELIWQMSTHKNGETFAAFLAQLAATWPEEVLIVVMDNVSYHRTPAIRAWWATQGDRLLPFWLPVYTPQLNLIERVWRFLKQHLACHRFWSDANGLLQAAATILAHLDVHFHTATPPAIRLVHDLRESA
jgi:transposase